MKFQTIRCYSGTCLESIRKDIENDREKLEMNITSISMTATDSRTRPVFAVMVVYG